MIKYIIFCDKMGYEYCGPEIDKLPSDLKFILDNVLKVDYNDIIGIYLSEISKTKDKNSFQSILDIHSNCCVMSLDGFLTKAYFVSDEAPDKVYRLSFYGGGNINGFDKIEQALISGCILNDLYFEIL